MSSYYGRRRSSMCLGPAPAVVIQHVGHPWGPQGWPRPGVGFASGGPRMPCDCSGCPGIWRHSDPVDPDDPESCAPRRTGPGDRCSDSGSGGSANVFVLGRMGANHVLEGGLDNPTDTWLGLGDD